MKVKFSAWLYLTALILTISNFAVAQTPNEVQIGTQIWMTKNLDVSKFRNGDPIPEAKTDEEWKKAGENKQPAWCYYENDPANGAKYGKLYNWYAVDDARGLAPVGWKIPTNTEWDQLTDALGGEALAGGKLKSKEGWLENGNGTDNVGFNGLPCGRRAANSFIDRGYYGFWWSSSFSDKKSPLFGDELKFAFYRFLNFSGDKIWEEYKLMDYGHSVRCIKILIVQDSREED